MKAEMHAHTAEVSSCGKIPAVEMVRLFAEQDYKMITFTDHIWEHWHDDAPADEWLAGYRAAREEGLKCGVNVLLGAEVRLKVSGDEDFLTYGWKEEDIPELFKMLNGSKTIAELSSAIRSYGIFFAQAHPYRPNLRAQDPALLDGVEVYNGNPRHNSHNDLAYELALNNGLVMLSGSDAHQYPDVGRGGLLLPDMIKTNDDLNAFLHSGYLADKEKFAACCIETL